jgi:hypothetical protein
MFVSSSVQDSMHRLICSAFSTSSHPMFCCWTPRNQFTRKYEQQKTFLIYYTVRIDIIGSTYRPSLAKKTRWLSLLCVRKWRSKFIWGLRVELLAYKDFLLGLCSLLLSKSPNYILPKCKHKGLWLRAPASSQKSTFTWAIRCWVRFSLRASVATDVDIWIEHEFDMCCYSVHLLQRCGECNDVSKTPHSKKRIRLKSWWHLVLRKEYGE